MLKVARRGQTRAGPDTTLTAAVKDMDSALAANEEKARQAEEGRRQKVDRARAGRKASLATARQRKEQEQPKLGL